MRLDDVISITDSPEQIIQRINNLHTKSNCETNHNKDLTDREVEILIHLTKGLSSKEIADKLNISVHTVVSHRKNLLEKTGIKSLSGLTLYAISKNFIKLEDHLT
jgi:DNA-binding NarL/FixJ family response regulator